MRRFWFHKDEEVRPDALVKVIKTEPKDETLEKAPPRKQPQRPPLPKGIAWGVAGLAVLLIAGLVYSFYYAAREQAKATLAADTGTLQAGLEDLQNLDPAAAAHKFSSLQNVSPSDFGTLFNFFGFAFGDVQDAVGAFGDLSNQLALFSQELGETASSSYGFFLNGSGAPFVADLSHLRDTIGAIQAASDKITAAAALANGVNGNGSSSAAAGSYFALKSQLQSAKSFLDAVIPWLATSTPHHILVLLQNPSEIRPAGGFLGSYVDLAIASGSVESVDVHDIADVDATFAPKIVPPKPLQAILTKWRPADANWFFDFPTSASETISFFDLSGLYAETSTTFDGAIAVSPKVVSDLLTVTGPLAVGKPATTFTADNFLTETQKIVEEGQATSATYPKKILSDLAHAIFAQLALSTDAQKQELFAMLLDWAAKRDVMAYFADPAMEGFAEQYGVGGDVYALPQRFNGDYFAVVDANIDGGKSDLYMSSTVSYVAQIGADGTLTDHVVVTRQDTATGNVPWWYRVENQNYEQIFVPDGATLANAAGGVLKKIVPKINYAKNGYGTDPLVASIENTEQTLFAYPGVAWHEESGRQVFTTWSAVNPGASKQFSLYYTRKLFTPPAPGVAYQFVFEKQAGTHRTYAYEIDAPLGYAFAENGLASYTYNSDDPPGRLVVNLTLQKL